MSTEITVNFEITPNPNTYKFVINQTIADDTAEFSDPVKTTNSPLAKKLFGFPWTEKVFIGPNFVSITKQDWVEWDALATPLCQMIKDHIESGFDVLLKQEQLEELGEDSDIVTRIKHLLNTEIRPAVAMDGGDIEFSRYENNIVYIYMRGACSGCPSATMTLKQGIEARVREVIPEVEEVVAL